MDIDVPAGRYVVAVSGGVDSVALLDMLAKLPGVELTVAHFDHGIRQDSGKDRLHVAKLAKQYGVPFVYHQGNLGAGASEALAREARYDFLHKVRKASAAQAIITAHHQDDLLETVILNLLRGTGRLGLSSLKNTDIIKRPMLHLPKQAIMTYAADQGLVWKEDSTNRDESYLRNYIRANILPRFDEQGRQALVGIAKKAYDLNQEIETELSNYLHLQPALIELDRHQFVMLPHSVAREVMAGWLRANTGAELTKPLIERLVVAGKTGRNNSRSDIDAVYWLDIRKDKLALVVRER
ncbi:MAG: tRNA lysidine(34) synthetase TilS [Candidatus Saccharimonadales bacterium]